MQDNTITIDSNESIARTFWRYAIPSIAAMVVNGLYQVIDGIFVGHYVGYEGLAGINIAWPIIGIIAGLGIMIGMGAGSLLSIYRGEGNNAKAQQTLSSSLWLIALFGALSMLLIHYFGTTLLTAQGAVGNTLNFSLDYINVFTWGAGFTIAAGALPMLIRNDDSPNFATGLMILGAVMNIILDYLFIGLFDLGLKGAAIATVISQLTVFIIGVGYFFSARSQIKINKLTLNFSIASKAVTLGASSLFMFLYFSFIVALHNKLFMVYGSSIHVGAFAIIGYLGTMYYLIAEGIAGGMQPPVSYYFGSKQIDKIKATVMLALKIILISGVVSVALLNLYPETVISLFSKNDPLLLAETQNGLRLHLFALYLDGFIFLASVYFMAVNQGGKALAISIGNMLIQLPFLYFLPQWLGVDGIWLSVPISNIVLTLIVAPLLWRDIQHSSQKHSVQIANANMVRSQ
ncbi:MATE family efflux transporter [Photobacterium profundum]|uniref:Multidrug export protein MepA n=1 Tax=Photobacterium profundum 3TCK TaxID=314280 RepID=Q1ZB83_9GAMM|nr:MATE family efflux transporter [Photobacterium profundum]EAS45259.1 Putative Na+-driven multidrug efflux pump [Photobacterium profundum 3TCK]PSV63541.1 MATE family efflux transporter [Photobacterium profundum]